MSGAPAVCTVPAVRLPDWQQRLAALVAQRMAAPFQWGVTDCCLWAADVVVAVTGVDVAAEFRGSYASAEQARRFVRSFKNLARLCDARLGPSVATALAQPADIGMLRERRMPALAVYGGACWMAQGERGLVPVPAGGMLRVWRVTCRQQ